MSNVRLKSHTDMEGTNWILVQVQTGKLLGLIGTWDEIYRVSTRSRGLTESTRLAQAVAEEYKTLGFVDGVKSV